MIEGIRKDVRKKLTEAEGILHDAGVEADHDSGIGEESNRFDPV
jgi:hypothetical protein